MIPYFSKTFLAGDIHSPNCDVLRILRKPDLSKIDANEIKITKKTNQKYFFFFIIDVSFLKKL